MDHPLHDDSHLPEPVEMTENNLDKLITKIIYKLDDDDKSRVRVFLDGTGCEVILG